MAIQPEPAECPTVAAVPVDHRGASLVSIVVVAHNHARFLDDALASVSVQTYQPVQTVVVDDGSTDDTPAVLDRHAGIVVLRQKNQGPSAARNAGLHVARGEFVLFLDADDVLLPDAVERGLTCYRRHPECGFVSGGFHYADAGARPIGQAIVPDVSRDHYAALLEGNYIAMLATVLYRRAVLDAVGGFDPSLMACEDYDLYLRVARRYPIAHFDDVVALYRRHGANATENDAHMLAGAVAVHGAQQAFLGEDAGRRAAYRRGAQFWRLYYGRRLIRRSLRSLRSASSVREGVEGMMQLFRHAPAEIPRLFGELLVGAGRRFAKTALPRPMQDQLRRIWRAWHGQPPPTGHVDFGSLRRLTPVSVEFGYDRGQPIDRRYIERFLAEHAGDIRGRVLEIGDNAYTLQFGGDRVTVSDVLNVKPGNPATTILGDLTDIRHIPSDLFDCVILTETLQLIYDMQAALRTVHRILKPGGVVLATMPGISQVDHGEWRDTWYWSLTERAAERLFGDLFSGGTHVTVYGNLLAATAFLQGMAVEELKPDELDHRDPHYPVTVAVKAVKAVKAGSAG